jgi:hypothetical protein
MAVSMPPRHLQLAFLLVGLSSSLVLAQKYEGPVPAKPDLPYLQHADNLVPTEAAEAKQEDRKDESTFSISGQSSPVRTPLQEPIFLIQAEKLIPERLQLYRLEVKNGQRQVVLGKKRKKDGAGPFHMSTSRLADRVYRIEVNEPLTEGEYCLTPAESNQVFCFQVY